MPIKTLHLTNYWHERSGGIATFYHQLMQAANRERHRMVLVVPGKEDEIRECGAHCRIYKVAARPSPFNPEYRTIYPRDFLLPGSKIQHILAEERPDVVEICDKYSFVHLGTLLRMRLAKGLSFRPVVVGLSCERMDENFASYVSRAWWGRAFARLYMRHVYFPAFDHHIAVSDHVAAELKAIADGHLVPRSVWVRAMGVDTEHFHPGKRSLKFRNELLARCNCPNEATLLLYAGRLAPEKNLDLLMDTMRELDKSAQRFHLVLAGDGIERQKLARAAEKHIPGMITFLGHQSDRDELARLYASSDFFVHPNPGEPFGIAPLEAMASGLPLVAPDRGGITSYANESNAYLSAPTPDSFACSILTARRMREETAQKAQTARKTAEGFAWPKVTESFLRLYEELHRLGIGRQPSRSAAAFASSEAGDLRAACLDSASKLAQKGFRFYVRSHQLLKAVSLSRNNPFQPELKDMQTQ
jgi:alpha-1,6-mannosyltransferase